MKLTLIAGLAAVALASPAFAAGDAAKGEQIFMKCKACHSIVKPDGTAIQKGGKIGPNLFGVVGRKAGSEEGFNYGPGLKEMGDKGLVWDEAAIADYVKNPTAFVKEKTGDAAAKSNMAFMLPSGGEDVAAYLAAAAK